MLSKSPRTITLEERCQGVEQNRIAADLNHHQPKYPPDCSLPTSQRQPKSRIVWVHHRLLGAQPSTAGHARVFKVGAPARGAQHQMQARTNLWLLKSTQTTQQLGKRVGIRVTSWYRGPGDFPRSVSRSYQSYSSLGVPDIEEGGGLKTPSQLLDLACSLILQYIIDPGPQNTYIKCFPSMLISHRRPMGDSWFHLS